MGELRSQVGEQIPSKKVSMSPKNIPSPKKRMAEDTSFDRDMCRFYWGDDYVQDDINGLGANASGLFADVLDKSSRIIQHANG